MFLTTLLTCQPAPPTTTGTAHSPGRRQSETHGLLYIQCTLYVNMNIALYIMYIHNCVYILYTLVIFRLPVKRMQSNLRKVLAIIFCSKYAYKLYDDDVKLYR